MEMVPAILAGMAIVLLLVVIIVAVRSAKTPTGILHGEVVRQVLGVKPIGPPPPIPPPKMPKEVQKVMSEESK